MKNARLFLLLFLTSALVFSQGYRGQGRLIGVVLDQEGRPLEGVKVKLFSLRGQSGFELTTDSRGEWKANYIRGGGWNIDFEKEGYAPKRIRTNIEESTKNPSLEIRLQKAEGLVVTEELKSSIIQGNKLFEEKKYEEAIGVYEGIIASYPDVYLIYKNIGNCYFQLEKYEKAEEAYLKVLEKEPRNFEIMLLVGNTFSNRGEAEKALEWYNKIEFEKIEDPLALFNIGSNYYSHSKFEEALKYYKRAVEIQGDFLDALYQLGLTHLTLGAYQEAIKAFEEYLKYDGESGRAAQVREFIEFLKKKIRD